MAASPIKKVNFETVGKENVADPTTIAPVPIKGLNLDLVKPKVAEKPAAIPAGLTAQEADEPILKENPHRFVLFPIKYNDVRRAPLCLAIDASRVKCFSYATK